MRQYPVELLLHLHDHQKRLPDLEKAYREAWEWFDPLNNGTHYMMISIFGNLDTPVPNNHTIWDWAEEIVKLAKRRFRDEGDLNKRNCPYFAMPSEFVTDLQFDKLSEELMSVPVEYKSVFSAPLIRKAQLDLLSKLSQSKARIKILVAPTGVGKTHVFLAYARLKGLKTVIVEPQRGMQSQLRTKYDVPLIYGMEHYTCAVERVPADESTCRIMGRDSPCTVGCKWHDAKEEFKRSINSYEPVACNPGNFQQWLSRTRIAIVDEYHQVFSQLTERKVIPSDKDQSTASEWLAEELAAAENTIETLYVEMNKLRFKGEIIPRDMFKEYSNAQFNATWMEFYLDNYDHSLIYSTGDTKYIKLDREATVKWFVQKYPEKEIILVSATPLKLKGVEDVEVIKTDIPVTTKVNAPVIYYPINNLSSQNVKNNPDYLREAADVILFFYRHFKEGSYTRKIIIHSGNTTTHAIPVADRLEAAGLKVMLHRKGKLEETITSFINENYDVLIVASADAGYDFYGDTFGLQFILKVPYPTLNGEWDAMEERFGIQYRWDMYAQATIDQMVQASGRICRGSDDLGITIILDNKFQAIYNRYPQFFPDSFKERLVDIRGELRNTIPSWSLDHYMPEAKE